MSADVKAKAEARRAKILAREKSKTVSALPTTEDEDLLLSLGESKAKERPLAARRNLIESVTVKTDDDLADTKEENSSSTAVDSANAGELTPKKETTENSGEGLSEKKSVKFPPKKTLEEIEREVAENTKKFDEKTLGKKSDENDKDTSEKKKKDSKEKEGNSDDKDKEGSKQNTSDKSSKVVKLKPVQKYSIEPSTAMRILRLILIVFCATWTGYRVVLRNKLALQSFQQQDQDEFDLSAGIPNQTFTTSTADRTWLQYFQYRINGQLETSISAILFIYWISKMFTPAVNSVFKVPKAKPSNLLQTAFEFLQTGLSTWLEGVYTVMGEISLHFFLLIISVIVWTIYLADVVNQQELNGTSPAALVNNNEL
eukprot:gene1544-1634_t